MAAADKQALRRRIRQAFPGEDERNRQSAVICRHIVAWHAFHEAGVIGMYVPLKREADVSPLIQTALALGKKLALPRIDKAPLMTMHSIAAMDELTEGVMHLMEPSPAAPVVPPEAIDLLLVPLEAIDEQGMRMGKGAGYYDHYLQRVKGITVGVVLRHQQVAQVPADSWDIPLQAMVDERGIHLFGQHAKQKY